MNPRLLKEFFNELFKRALKGRILDLLKDFQRKKNGFKRKFLDLKIKKIFKTKIVDFQRTFKARIEGFL